MYLNTKSIFDTKHHINTNFTFEDLNFVLNGYVQTEFVSEQKGFRNISITKIPG